MMLKDMTLLFQSYAGSVVFTTPLSVQFPEYHNFWHCQSEDGKEYQIYGEKKGAQENASND